MTMKRRSNLIRPRKISNKRPPTIKACPNRLWKIKLSTKTAIIRTCTSRGRGQWLSNNFRAP
jgi:hypothetical protein